MNFDWLFDGSWLGHVGIMLLIAACLATRPDWQRNLTITAALFGVAASVVIIDRLSYAFLFGVLVIAVVIRAARDAFQAANIRFTDEETAMQTAHFAGLSPQLARRLFDQGHWIDASMGETLIREDQAAPCLFYIAHGTAVIEREGQMVGQCRGGDLVGEATALGSDAATGTVRLATPARLWFVPADALQNFLEANPAIAAALNAGFVRALSGKLADANARLAASGDAA